MYHVAPEATAVHNLTAYRLLRLLEPWVASAHYIATPAFNLGEPTNFGSCAGSVGVIR